MQTTYHVLTTAMVIVVFSVLSLAMPNTAHASFLDDSAAATIEETHPVLDVDVSSLTLMDRTMSGDSDFSDLNDGLNNGLGSADSKFDLDVAMNLTGGGSAAQAVPEPNSITIILLGGILGLSAMRRRQI